MKNTSQRLPRLALVVLACALPSSIALATPPPTPAPAPAASAARSIYRFDVSITGIETGAHPAPATYTLILQENQHGALSTGTNIALGVNGALRQDVGLSLHLEYELRSGVVVLEGGVELSSVDPVTPGHAAPTIHRVRADGVTPITVGTPALFASVYDLVSKRRYEIMVSAQRLL